VLGFEHDSAIRCVFSARYTDRRIRRIMKTMRPLPGSGTVLLNQQYIISQPQQDQDLVPNPIQIDYSQRALNQRPALQPA